jgi:hypothetical protein
VGNLWRPDYFSENRTARGGDYRDGSPGNYYVPPGYNGPPPEFFKVDESSGC